MSGKARGVGKDDIRVGPVAGRRERVGLLDPNLRAPSQVVLRFADPWTNYLVGAAAIRSFVVFVDWAPRHTGCRFLQRKINRYKSRVTKSRNGERRQWGGDFIGHEE